MAKNLFYLIDKISDIKKYNIIKCQYLRIFEEDYKETIRYLQKQGMFGLFNLENEECFSLEGSIFIAELKERSFLLQKLEQIGFTSKNNVWNVIKIAEHGITLYAADPEIKENFIMVPWNSINLLLKAEK